MTQNQHIKEYWQSYKPKHTDLAAFKRLCLEMLEPNLSKYKKACEMFMHPKIKLTRDGGLFEASYPGTKIKIVYYPKISTMYLRGNYIKLPHWIYLTKYIYQLHLVADKIVKRDAIEHERDAQRYRQLMNCYEWYRAAANESEYEFEIDLDAIYDEL